MRSDAIYPDFSASQANRAAVPEAGPAVPGAAAAGEAAPEGAVRGASQPGGAAGGPAGQLSIPPFSWLGNAAWPDFPG